MKKEVFEYFARNEGQHWWHVGKYACALRLLKQFDVEGKKVLEIGASFGYLSQEIARFAECVALDQNREILKAGGYPYAVCGDANHLPFENESFEHVVALDVLEHLADDRACVSEIFRVLRPGGKALVFVPACPFLWSDLDVINNHFRRYTKTKLRCLLSGCQGIEILKLSYFNSLLFVPILLVRLIQRAIKKRWKNVSTESMSSPPAPVNSVLKALFLFEGRLVSRLDFPIGVSLLAAVKKSAEYRCESN